MAERPGGGVRNIRAMFEAKADSSPPSRGRSPAGSEGFGARSDSSRPVSKVRASFVSVDGKSGLLAMQSGIHRKNSDALASESGETPPVLERTLSGGINGTAARRTPSMARVQEEEVTKGNDGHSGVELPEIASTKLAIHPRKEDEGSPESKSKKDVASAMAKEAVQAVGEKAAELKSKIAPKAAASKPPAISTKNASKPHSGPQSAKSHVSAKTPTTPKQSSKPSTSRPSLSKPLATRAARTSGVSERDASKSTGNSVSKQPAAAGKTPTNTPKSVGAKKPANSSPSTFNKPVPKSPTKPVKLPPGAMATTTSSSAKLGRESTPEGVRKSGGAAVTRTASTASSATGPSKNSRASLASASKTTDRSPSRVATNTKPADDARLARMMRPTQASASKTHEKEPQAPTRKTSGPGPARTSGQGVTRAERPQQVKNSIPASVPKPVNLVAKPSTSKPVTAKTPTGKSSVSKAAAGKPAAGEPTLTEFTSQLQTPKETEPVQNQAAAVEPHSARGEILPPMPDTAIEAKITEETTTNAQENQAPEFETLSPDLLLNEPSAPVVHELAPGGLNKHDPVAVSRVADAPSPADVANEPVMTHSEEIAPETPVEPLPINIAPESPLEAALAPPASAIAEALTEPAPIPKLPAPTANEATAQAFELEMAANELAQVDSAGPAAPPELQNATPPPGASKPGSRPGIQRTASVDLRLPEAATPPKPSFDEIEAARRESTAAGEMVDLPGVPELGKLDEATVTAEQSSLEATETLAMTTSTPTGNPNAAASEPSIEVVTGLSDVD